MLAPWRKSNDKPRQRIKKQRCYFAYKGPCSLSYGFPSSHVQMWELCNKSFFLQSSRYVSNEQSCLKTTGLYDDLLLLSSLFHFFYFIFSAPISFSLCSPISPLVFNILSQLFIKCSRKTIVYIYMYDIYFIKHMNFCLTKKIMTSWFHLVDLVWIKC